MATGTGDLNRRFAFDKRGAAGDGHGGTSTAFVEQFVVSAQVTAMRGGESVMQARLAGQHVQVVRVRSSSSTRLVTPTWRARDARSGAIFNIRDVTPSEDRAWIDFLCESGVAA